MHGLFVSSLCSDNLYNGPLSLLLWLDKIVLFKFTCFTANINRTYIFLIAHHTDVKFGILYLTYKYKFSFTELYYILLS